VDEAGNKNLQNGEAMDFEEVDPLEAFMNTLVVPDDKNLMQQN